MKEKRCTHGKDECHQAEQFIISETYLRAAVRQNVIPNSPYIFHCQGQMEHIGGAMESEAWKSSASGKEAAGQTRPAFSPQLTVSQESGKKLLHATRGCALTKEIWMNVRRENSHWVNNRCWSTWRTRFLSGTNWNMTGILVQNGAPLCRDWKQWQN